MSDSLRVLVIGAHPDDADIKTGGTAAQWCALGHTVKLVSVCDGAAGHQTDWGPKLAERRRREAEAAAAVIGATYEILNEPDGELQPTLEARRKIIRLIRTFQPDVVITHRTVDYHPDHAATGQLVRDAAYLVTVPGVCPELPHVNRTPVILYFSDAFKQPSPFIPHVVVDVSAHVDAVVAMLACHASQFYEWIPYNAGYLNQVPQEAEARRRWLDERIRRRLRPMTRRFRERIGDTYGPERGPRVEFVEVYEVSEFGAPLDAETRARLFPFVPTGTTQPSSFVRKEWVDIPEEE